MKFPLIINNPIVINSPKIFEINLSVITIKVHAICVLIGVIVSLICTLYMYKKCKNGIFDVFNMFIWIIPFGIFGGRLHHVLTSLKFYFDSNFSSLMLIPKVWMGGMGMWGGIVFGILGAYIASKKYKIDFRKFLDNVSPGLILGQCIGRFGNYFNQELFGRPTNMNWGLKIDSFSLYFPSEYPENTLFHPIFLYEMIWNIIGFLLLIFIMNNKRIVHQGQIFCCYIIYYSFGRILIEPLKFSNEYNYLDIKLNIIISILSSLIAIILFFKIKKKY